MKSDRLKRVADNLTLSLGQRVFLEGDQFSDLVIALKVAAEDMDHLEGENRDFRKIIAAHSVHQVWNIPYLPLTRRADFYNTFININTPDGAA